MGTAVYDSPKPLQANPCTSGDLVSGYGVVTASKVKPESFSETLKMAKGAADFLNAYTYEISQHKNFERELKGLSVMVAY